MRRIDLPLTGLVLLRLAVTAAATLPGVVASGARLKQRTGTCKFTSP
jgi:hypothetical protein